MKTRKLSILYFHLRFYVIKPTFFIFDIEDFSDCCTDNEIISGCRIEKSVTGSAGWECLCGIGCEREFPFTTRTECETKLKGIGFASY